MLQLVRNYSPFTVIILFIYCLLLHLPGLMHPLSPAAGSAVYNVLLSIPDTIFHHNAFCYSLLTIILVFAQGIYLNNISERHRLYLNSTYAPLFSYISVTALLPKSVLFSAPLIAIWPLLVAVDVSLSLPQPLSPRAHIFNVGFLLSLAALIFFPSVGFLLFFIIALLLLRPLNAGEWIVGALGYFTPLYFGAGILFLNDALPLLKAWPHLGISLPGQIRRALHLAVATGTIVILLWSGLYILQGALLRFAISVRRGWGAIIAALIVALAVAVITPADEPLAWRTPVPFIALVAALPVANEKRSAFSTFIFLLLLAAGIFGAWFSPR